jgi:hypothetical protein
VFVRLGGESFPGTNTLAYYKNLLITDKKGFLTLAPAPGNTNWMGRVYTVGFLKKIACFVKKYIFFNFNRNPSYS